jgi:hypothetical protein
MTELIDYVFDAYPCKHRSTGVPLGDPDLVIAISTSINNPSTAWKLARRHVRKADPDESWALYMRDEENPKRVSLPVPGGTVSWARPWDRLRDGRIHSPEWNRYLVDDNEKDVFELV